MARRTPLHDLHCRLGARMVDFAGWDMPVQFDGIIAEHGRCRDRAALFDVSHMGQVVVRGEGVLDAFEGLVPAAVRTLPAGRMRYSQFTDDAGGILDDLIVSHVDDGHLGLVINAANREAGMAHLRRHMGGRFDVAERDDRALLALQGPAAAGVMADLAPPSAALPFMAVATMPVAGVACAVGRCGYTGEDGFEISVAAEDAEALATRLLARPEVGPAGLGARDSLRLEAGLPLHGHDIGPDTTPVEAGLGWSIPKRRREEGGFPGHAVIKKQLDHGPERRLVALRPDGRAPAREGAVIATPEGEEIGRVTSGGFGPSVGGPVALGYVRAHLAEPGTTLALLVRGRSHPARVVASPFVPHRYRRPPPVTGVPS